MQEVNNICLKLRKVNRKSVGFTLPKNIVEKYKLVSGMNAVVSVLLEKEYNHYKCGVCNYDWLDEQTSEYQECVACGESSHILKMKGGDKNG